MPSIDRLNALDTTPAVPSMVQRLDALDKGPSLVSHLDTLDARPEYGITGFEHYPRPLGEAPRRTESIGQTVWQPIKHGFMEPTYFQGTIPGALERAFRIAGGPFGAVGNLAEMGAEQAPRLFGGEAQSTPESKIIGQLAPFAIPGSWINKATGLATRATGLPYLAGKLGWARAPRAISALEELMAARQGAGAPVTAEEIQTALAAPPSKAMIAESLPLFSREAETSMLGIPAPIRRLGAPISGMYSKFIGPKYSEMERFGPEGETISQMFARVDQIRDMQIAKNIQVPFIKRLDALSQEERTNLFQSLDFDAVTGKPRAVPMNDTVEGLAVDIANQLLSSKTGAFIPGLEKAGIKVEPRQEIMMPHEFSPAQKAELLTTPSPETELLRRVMGMKGSLRSDRPSPAEFMREVNLPGYIEDPRQALLLRGARVFQRIGEQEVLGPKDENLWALLKQIEQRSPWEAREATRVAAKILHRDPMDLDLGWLARGASNYAAFTYLSLAWIPHLSQFMQGALRTNLSQALYAVGKTIIGYPELREAARDVGALANLASRRVYMDLLGTTGEVVKAPLMLFHGALKWNTVMGAELGRMWAGKLQGRLTELTPNDLPILVREFKKLLFNDQEIGRILSSKSMTPQDIDRISYAISEQMMFFPKSGRRSEFFDTGWGHIFGIFKGFITNASRLMYQSVITEAKHGNYKPMAKLLYLIPTGTLVGEPIADLKAIVRGTRRPSPSTTEGLLERGMQNLLSVASFGIGADFLSSMIQSKAGVTGFLEGPVVADIDDFLRRLITIGWSASLKSTDEFERQLYEMGRSLVRKTPAIGPFMGNVTLPPSQGIKSKPPGSTPMGGYFGDVLGASERAEMEARMKSLRAANQNRFHQFLYRNLGGEG